MLRRLSLVLLLLFPVICSAIETAEERHRKKQHQLDAECEYARQIALAPQKLEIYKECMRKGERSKAYCEKQGDDFNGVPRGSANVFPFYNLPECQKAFKHRKTYRAAD